MPKKPPEGPLPTPEEPQQPTLLAHSLNLQVRTKIETALDPVLQPLYTALKTAYCKRFQPDLFSFDHFWEELCRYNKIYHYIRLSQNSKTWWKSNPVDQRKIELFASMTGTLLEEFLINYVTLSEAGFKGSGNQGICERFLDLFLDMTASDKEDWPKFMKRRLEEMRSEQVELGFKTYDLRSGYVLEESKFTPSDGMEGYRELQFEFQHVSGGKASLPTVRYGIYNEGKSAVIYCLQNEGFGLFKMSYESLKRKLKFIEERKSGTYAEPIASGKMRKSLTPEETTSLFQYYRSKKEDLELSDEFFFGFDNFMIDWEEEDIYREGLAIAENERAMIGEITKSLRKGLKSGDGLRSVPGGSLVSLALAVKRLHEVGVREIATPLILPERLHWHYSERLLDERIFKSKLAALRRLAYEFEGVEIVEGNFEFNIEKLTVEERCGDDYAILRLGDEIRPRREPVKEFFGEAFAP